MTWLSRVCGIGRARDDSYIYRKKETTYIESHVWHDSVTEWVHRALLWTYRALWRIFRALGSFRCVTTDGGDRKLNKNTTAKISNKFSRESTDISNMFLRKSSRFEIGFYVSKRSPRHSKRSIRKTDRSWDPNILSLVSSESTLGTLMTHSCDIVTHCNTLQHAATHSHKWRCSFTCVTWLMHLALIWFVCAAVCCSVLQCAAVCCSVLQCVVVFCSVLQFVAVCCTHLILRTDICDMTPWSDWRVLQCVCSVFAVCCSVLQYVAVCCSVLQCVAVCCSVVQCVAVRCSVFAVCCSVQSCVAVCCSVLQCVTLHQTATHCNTMLARYLFKPPQRTATYCNTLQHTASHCIAL